MDNAYYPSAQKTGNLHTDFRMLFEHMYESKRQIADLNAKLDAAHNRINEMKKDHTSEMDRLQGPSNTKILGLRVKGTVPTNGQVLTYDSANGWFAFM